MRRNDWLKAKLSQVERFDAKSLVGDGMVGGETVEFGTRNSCFASRDCGTAYIISEYEFDETKGEI